MSLVNPEGGSILAEVATAILCLLLWLVVYAAVLLFDSACTEVAR